MTQYIKKLPAVFQTVTEKKFFDATLDQVFSKKDSDLLFGYIGQRMPGRYNPVSDFYLPEPSKDRTWWQLEATAFARNPDTTKTNIFFYDDLLNRINYYGGNTLNQDRLFESEYYSWAPPIDFDMFINYQNYYWIEQGLAVINIVGVNGADIIGKASYTTPPTATPPNLTLTTGMKITLASDPLYVTPHTIENIGGCVGIRLIPDYPDYTSGTILEYLPWSGSIQLTNGRIIQDTNWDTLTWDVEAEPGNGDYITIERGSLDRNAWSRTNKWFHIDAINKTIAATNTPFPINATRALRPIIQFVADLVLFNSGTQYKASIAYGFKDDLFGSPLLLSQFQGQLQTVLDSTYGITLANGQLVCFFDDPINHQNIYSVSISGGNVTFTISGSAVIEGDILFATENAPYNGAARGQTWYYSAGVWAEAANDKVSNNQPPLFQLYDHNGVKLNDTITYPQNNFTGNKIFSYKINTEPGATVDPVLKFPIVYTSLGQSSDIVFQNNLITDRYVYSTSGLSIDGYYYYTTAGITDFLNSWNLYSPCPCSDIIPPPPANCISKSKQRVIDKFVVGYGTEYQFELSVTPYGYPTTPDLIVSVNGKEVKDASVQTGGYTLASINGRIYVNLQTYLTSLLTITQSQPPVVEVDTYTQGTLDPGASGYFEIPQQLEANSTQREISEISASNLIDQFSSIIQNQIGFTGVAFGANNNYRDTRKNRSAGTRILQNVAPLLKTMLVSSADELDVISSIRFSQDEYTKFKNKYLRTALQLINREFNPVQYHNNTIVISAWVDEILKAVNISKEFSNAFAYSYMIANGTSYSNETHVVPIGGFISLTNYLDLSDPKNALYIYDVTGQEQLLMVGVDYEIVSTNLVVDIQFNSSLVGKTIYAAFYKNPLPAYIPSTPTKVGAYGAYIPRIELDTSYTVPTNVIIGHDGSKTIVYNDYRDQLLLELEKRIYNLLQYRFRNQYYLPLRLESVKPGHFRQTRYSNAEYLDITQSYFNKWSAKNKANYQANDWSTASAALPLNSPLLWKLYNYSKAHNMSGVPLNLPGNWKGIFQYYYDTIYPDTRPWEMLGFSIQPSWWVAQYGVGITNLAGQRVWPNTPTYALMWADLEAGIIRQGPSAIYDPITLLPQAQEMWKRPGLSTIIPVSAVGELIPVPTLFNIAVSGNLYNPFDGFSDNWKYGDGAPVEQAWMSTSGYAFSVQEFLYLMKPGPFGELLWDTVGTERSPGKMNIPGINNPVLSSTNWQYVQNDTFSSSDPFFAWMRPKNSTQIVHAEIIDGTVNIRYGYQRWISDRILFLNKDITTTFGQKVRTLDVNLANKLAGFTNKDTTNTYIESVSTGASTTSLLIPSNNFEVILHQGQPIKTYSYSGVIIRALGDGTFIVYGYDLLNSEFRVLDRSNAQLIDITVGGSPAEFKIYAAGETYIQGDIVRYNGVYYLSLVTQVAGKFNSADWQRLKALPTVGGISVTYRPISEITTTTVPYGTILNSAQEVFDLLIGWGAYLESQGWQFTEVSQDTNQVNDWLYSAKQFLFWLNSNWAPDASIQVSPAANNATLTVERGYPADVESISNGVYSILDKYGVAIPPTGTTTDRDGATITVSPTDLASGGIYFLQVNATETEHILIFDNSTSFSDVIYDSLLRARQQRLRFNGFRSNGWYGKMEAPGYLIIDNQLVPNYDTIVDSMRYYYDPNVTIDNPSLEDLGRHLIGYESKSYLDNLQVSNAVQYLFYQGSIRQKGTAQALNKLFRSTKVQGNDTIEVYEEWALRTGKFGNTIKQVSTEFILKPEQNTGEVIVSRLNFVPSNIGFIKEINILNAQNTYINIPKIVISLPDATPSGWTLFSTLVTYYPGQIVRYDNALGNPVYYSSNITQGPGPFVPANWTVVLETRVAKAYVVLDSSGVISRVDITDTGYGYLSAPNIGIDSGTESHQLDKLYAVWQGEIVRDTALDNIIEIDIDDTATWTVRPSDPQYSLEFPTTSIISYQTPNAGYVNFNDVTWASFDSTSTAINWGTSSLNPKENNTVWVAKTFVGDWSVFKMIKLDPMIHPWSIVEDAAGNLNLKTDLGTVLVPQLSSTPGISTDFGNMICLQLVTGGVVDPATNYAVTFAQYVDPNDPTHNSYELLTLDGIQITSTNIPGYASLTDLLLFKTLRFETTPTIPSYVATNDKLWIDNSTLSFITGTGATGSTVMNIASVISGSVLIGATVSGGTLTGTATIVSYGTFNGVSGTVNLSIPQTWSTSTQVTLNASVPLQWSVSVYKPTTSPVLTKYRKQENLINTTLFESAQVFQTTTQTELVQLPVYDPFKDILPALAKQNITYMLSQDPARYNITGDTRLFSENIIFGEKQVGKLWWDLSEVRYVYYEQPIALDGTETASQNLTYRRDYWGQIFPGSTIKIYEWTKSSVPPAQYTGTGVPRSTTDYVQITTSNRFTNISETNYYFWVLNAANKPNIENRTLSAIEVGRLLSSPKGQGFTFFSPIQQTTTNNSYMFYNVQEILAYQGDNIQIQYRLSDNNDQPHAQWALFREGDTSSLVTDQYWNKMVDSLCGYTQILPASAEWGNGIFIAQYLPWDVYGWDIAPWDDATLLTTPLYGEILPVPDPSLSDSEQHGISYRPRQSMFVDLYTARKVFVQAANNLLKYIPIRDDNPNWNVGVLTNTYWNYVNWYNIGFENATPTAVFATLVAAQTALTAGQFQNGDIIEITNGTGDGRFVLYNVIQPNPNISTQIFQKVGIESSAINLFNTIYTVENVYGLSVELRELLGALRTEVFIDKHVVDQNELFFSLLNYVVSEQKNPDWLFKTSYIYIKENNIPLTQATLYVPDQINNIVDYIIDSKPYHTQIRDYSSTYTTLDVATGTSSDSVKQKISIEFGPTVYAGDPYPQYLIDANTLNQLISQQVVYTVPLTFFDSSKIGYSQLYPYTFDFNSLNLNNPQTFITPANVVAARIGTTTLFYGRDYYVEYNNNTTYTIYFFNNPGPGMVLEAYVLWDAGTLMNLTFNSYRSEFAVGYANDNFVVNVDTALIANNISAIPSLAPATLAPYVGWGEVWDQDLGTTGQIIVAAGGTSSVPWSAPLVPYTLPNTISYKENLNITNGSSFYRNSNYFSGTMVYDLAAPTSTTENLDVLTVYVDPATHPVGTDIFPQPLNEPGVVWVNGERIEYYEKKYVAINTWELGVLRRGTLGTAPNFHSYLIPSVLNPLILVPNCVWIEKSNVILNANDQVWNAIDSNGNPVTEQNWNIASNYNKGDWISYLGVVYSANINITAGGLAPNVNSQWTQITGKTGPIYTDVQWVPLGGLWYSHTSQSTFLQDSQGKAVP